MTVASLASGVLGAVSIDSMVEQRGKERFAKRELSFSVVDGRYRRSLI